MQNLEVYQVESDLVQFEYVVGDHSVPFRREVCVDTSAPGCCRIFIGKRCPKAQRDTLVCQELSRCYSAIDPLTLFPIFTNTPRSLDHLLPYEHVPGTEYVPPAPSRPTPDPPDPESPPLSNGLPHVNGQPNGQHHHWHDSSDFTTPTSETTTGSDDDNLEVITPSERRERLERDYQYYVDRSIPVLPSLRALFRPRSSSFSSDTAAPNALQPSVPPGISPAYIPGAHDLNINPFGSRSNGSP